MKTKKIKSKQVKVTRNTIAKRIANDPANALAVANYGHDGEAISKRFAESSSERRPHAFTATREFFPSDALGDLIQEVLFIEEQCKAITKQRDEERQAKKEGRKVKVFPNSVLANTTDTRERLLKQNEIEIALGQICVDRIRDRDSSFFRKFARLLDSECKVRSATTEIFRDKIRAVRAEVLAKVNAGEEINITTLAEDRGIDVRVLRRICRELGVAPKRPGRPRK